jgi:hypothetical protein
VAKKKIMSKSKKIFHGFDCFLQLENMKKELLVIACQEKRGEYGVRLITQCPPMTESTGANALEPIVDIKFYVYYY